MATVLMAIGFTLVLPLSNPGADGGLAVASTVSAPAGASSLGIRPWGASGGFLGGAVSEGGCFGGVRLGVVSPREYGLGRTVRCCELPLGLGR